MKDYGDATATQMQLQLRCNGLAWGRVDDTWNVVLHLFVCLVVFVQVSIQHGKLVILVGLVTFRVVSISQLQEQEQEQSQEQQQEQP